MQLLYFITLLVTISPLATATDGGLKPWGVETYSDYRCKNMLSARGDQSRDSDCQRIEHMYPAFSVSATVPRGYALTVYVSNDCSGEGYTTTGSWQCFQFWRDMWEQTGTGPLQEAHYQNEGFKSYWLRKTD